MTNKMTRYEQKPFWHWGQMVKIKIIMYAGKLNTEAADQCIILMNKILKIVKSIQMVPTPKKNKRAKN